MLTPVSKKRKNRIKEDLKHFIEDKKIINSLGNKPFIEDIELFEWGVKATIDISKVTGYEDVEKHQDYIKQLFRAYEVDISNNEGKVIIEIINKEIDDLEYSFSKLPSTTLLLGYDRKGEPITVDMKKTPHIGVQGTSNTGKSKMVELTLKNLRDVDIVLLNCFSDDFTNIKSRRINGNENILVFLNDLVLDPYVRKRPLYLVLDELNVLGKDKKINQAIIDILAQARHFNIYLIALGQTLLKENCPYKHLFNVRVTFRAIDKSSISAFLGCTVENTKLNQREFICYSDSIYRGKSYMMKLKTDQLK
ncbi:hypothetical protein ACQPUZ_04935 [Clostridium tertium]